jgi:hypothetical protein
MAYEAVAAFIGKLRERETPQVDGGMGGVLRAKGFRQHRAHAQTTIDLAHFCLALDSCREHRRAGRSGLGQLRTHALQQRGALRSARSARAITVGVIVTPSFFAACGRHCLSVKGYCRANNSVRNRAMAHERLKRPRIDSTGRQGVSSSSRP